jgi:hypothetical protein
VVGHLGATTRVHLNIGASEIRSPVGTGGALFPPRNLLSSPNASSSCRVSQNELSTGILKSAVHAVEPLLRCSDTLPHQKLSHLTNVFLSLANYVANSG